MGARIGIIPGRSYLKRGFSALQMLYWCSVGSSTTYIVSYMTSIRQASASLTGLLLAVFMLCGCVGQFLVNSICDKKQNNRMVFMTGMAASLALWYGVYFAPGLPMLFVMYGLLGMLQPTMAAVLDTWLIRSFPDDAGAYSPIRSLGSLSYSCLMAVMGRSIDGIGHSVMVVLPTVFTAGAIAMAYFMPEIPALSQQNAGKKNSSLKSIQPVVWMFVLAMAAMGMANMPLLNMNLLVIGSVGGTVTHSGNAIAFNTVAEFITMQFLMRVLKKLPARRQLVLAGFLYLASTAIIFSGTGIWAMYIAFFINGVAYGIILPARRQFINETAPEDQLNRMHGVGDMAYNSIGGLIGNQCGGMVIDRWGVSVMISISLALEAVAFALMTAFKRLMKTGNADKGIDSAA